MRLLKKVRGPLSTLAVFAFSINGAWAQGLSGEQSVGLLGESDFVKWALTQGGLVIVLIIVGWSYRRDLTRLLQEEKERTKILTDLVQESTTALTRMADAVGTCPFKQDGR